MSAHPTPAVRPQLHHVCTNAPVAATRSKSRSDPQIRGSEFRTRLGTRNIMSTARTLTLVRTVLSVALLLVAFGRSMAQTPSSKETPSCESGLEWSAIDRLRCLASRAPSTKSASCVARAPNGWKTYVDKVHGFCLSYPSVYQRRNQPWVVCKRADVWRIQTPRLSRKLCD